MWNIINLPQKGIMVFLLVDLYYKKLTLKKKNKLTLLVLF